MEGSIQLKTERSGPFKAERSGLFKEVLFGRWMGAFVGGGVSPGLAGERAQEGRAQEGRAQEGRVQEGRVQEGRARESLGGLGRELWATIMGGQRGACRSWCPTGGQALLLLGVFQLSPALLSKARLQLRRSTMDETPADCFSRLEVT
ncbi:hypothetical protein, partial [Streptosporangium carneum]|uniref:hypothetical protein n=1 Tax=Streptosporangium carneum TaxID=47481 RepID=UPI0022F2C448